MQRFGGIQSDVLYPPPPKRDYRCDGYGDYLFGVSRLSPLKRFDLVLRALAEPVAAGIRCVIAGEGAELRAAQAARGASSISSIACSSSAGLSDAELIDHLARCRAVVFPPFNEDYGFVTVEAFMCGKPVITCRDSGGPAELVRDGENGFVTDPTPEALAAAMRAVMDDRNLALRMGEAGAADGDGDDVARRGAETAARVGSRFARLRRAAGARPPSLSVSRSASLRSLHSDR